MAIDTETLGLNPHRDRLCVVQLSTGDGTADVVQIVPGGPAPVNLMRVLADDSVLKIFHFARFDLAVLFHRLGVMPGPVYCTKIASKLARTYTDRHGLKDVVRETVGVDLSKQQQSSDWGADTLSRPNWTTPPPTCCTCTRRRRGSMRCWPGRAAPNWRRIASDSCPPAPSSTCSAGPKPTSSRTPEPYPRGNYEAPGHCGHMAGAARPEGPGCLGCELLR